MEWGAEPSDSCRSIVRWAARHGVPEVYGFEKGTSSHGGLVGSYTQVWRGPSGAWWFSSIRTSAFQADTEHAERIDRGARVRRKGVEGFFRALDLTSFWADEAWPEEGVHGVDGVTWYFGGVRAGVSRARQLWSPSEGGDAFLLRRAFASARPTFLAWARPPSRW